MTVIRDAARRVRLAYLAAVDRASGGEPERGDVPGWVLVTLMTAGLVVTLWAVAGPTLTNVFNAAMNRVLGM